MRLLLRLTFCFVVTLTIFDSNGQETIELLQLSGMTTMSAEGDVLPFVRITNQTGKYQTTSSLQGVYSMVVKPGDTIHYQFIGFTPETFVVPSQPTNRFITHTQRMSIDTFYLPEALVKPLPSKQRLEYEFVYKDITDDQLALAQQNTEMSQLMFIANVLMKDGSENAGAFQEKYIDRISNSNQMPSQNIFSPAAWIDFIDQVLKKKK